MKVVFVGNVVDGLTVYGPFEDDDAVLFAEYVDEEWLIVDVNNPKDYGN